jgi:hypothetical protein
MVADREQAVVGIGTGLADVKFSAVRAFGLRSMKDAHGRWGHTADLRNGKMTDRGAECER